MENKALKNTENKGNAISRIVSNHYRIGYDSTSDRSQKAYALFDKNQNRLIYITNKKWKVKLGLLVAKLLGGGDIY